MIAFFKILAKGAAWIVGITLLLGLFIGLAWWANIPLFTSAVALCVIAAFVVLFIAGRRVFVWYNKRRYVRHVLENDPSLVQEEVQEETVSSMSNAWQHGARRQGRLSGKSSPWAFMLGTDDRDTIVNALLGSGNDSFEDRNALLQWSTLPELVLLRPHEKYLQSVALLEHNQVEWEDLLIDLLKSRKQHNLGALVVTVKANLLAQHTHDIEGYARVLRARIHEISTTAAAHLPLYVLVTQSECLPGMCHVVESFSEERRARLLGTTFPLWTSYTDDFDEESVPPTSYGEYAHITITQAVSALRTQIIRDAATTHKRPQKDVYAAPGAVESLEKGLSVFLNCLFFAKSSGATARLRGVYFTCTNTGRGTNTGAFVASSLPKSMVAPISPMGVTPVSPTGATPISPTGVTPMSPTGVTPMSPMGVTPVSPTGATPMSPMGVTPVSPTGATPMSPMGVTPMSPTGATPLASPAPISTGAPSVATAVNVEGMPNILFTPPSAPITHKAVPSAADFPTPSSSKGLKAETTASPNLVTQANDDASLHTALPLTPNTDLLQSPLDNTWDRPSSTPWDMAFVEEIFFQRLPADRFLPQPIKHGLRFELLALPCTGAWYLVLFSFCGIIAANTIYTSHTMRGLKEIEIVAQEKTLAPGYAELFQQSSRLKYLDSALRRWWFPFLGIDQLPTERTKAAYVFTNKMQQNLIPQIIKALLQLNDGYVLSGQNAQSVQGTQARQRPQGQEKDHALASHTARCLLWMQDAVAAQLQGTKFTNPLPPPPVPAAEKTPHNTEPRVALTGDMTDIDTLDINALWSLNFGEFFLHYTKVVDKIALETLQKQLAEAVHTLFDNNERNMLAYLEHYVNTQLSRKAVPLSDFWPNVPAGTEGFTQVLPMYTKAGYTLLAEQLQALLGNDMGALTEQAFWKDYEQRYAAAWKEFILQTDMAWLDVTQVSTLYTTAMVKKFEDMPSMRLLKRAAEELAPLNASMVAPAWVEQLLLMQALADVVRLSTKTKPHSMMALPSTIMSIFETPDESFSALLATQDMSMVMDATNDLRTYQQAFKELQGTLTSEAGTYELARAEYAGIAKDSNFAIGHKVLQTLLERIGVSLTQQNTSLTAHARLAQAAKPDADNPVAYIMQGPLRFLAHTLTCASALTVQKYWEATVLAPAIVLPKEKLEMALAGEQGLLQAFLKDIADPFLQRRVGSYAAKSWMSTIFPFTEDFLSFIQQGSVVGANMPQESYAINMISQTSDVNANATERLQYLELSVDSVPTADAASTGGTTTLRNNNYPARKTFTYIPKEPSVMRLTLSFPSVKLSYVYPDMPAFLKDFAYGERVFTPEDFPAQAESLKTLGIEHIKVRILAENAADIVAAQEHTLPPIPERITHVW